MGPQIRLLQSVGFALAMSGVAVAHPAPAPDGTAQVTVSLADLRLDTEAGRRVAHTRLQRAAAWACGPAPSHLADLKGVAVFEACRRQALQEAEQRLVTLQGARQTVSR